MTVEIVADTQDHCGEGPLWHPEESVLYWTDIPKGRVYRYDPATNGVETVYEGMQVGGMTLQDDGSLLFFGDRGSILRWAKGDVTTLLDGIETEEETRVNDVIADPEGRVFAGTMPAPGRLGRLYRIDRDLTVTKIMSGIGCANGMGFTPDLGRMYFTDSGTREIGIWNYDRATGELSDSRLFVRTPEGEGVPDGMTVDRDGHVWSARWDGGGCFRYDALGKRLIHEIPLPEVGPVTCPLFAGPGYDDLYLTSAGGGDRERNGANAGALFRVRGLVTGGKPEFRSRLNR